MAPQSEARGHLHAVEEEPPDGRVHRQADGVRELPDALPQAEQHVGLPVSHEAAQGQLQQPAIFDPFLELEPLPHGQHAEGH